MKPRRRGKVLKMHEAATGAPAPID